MLAQAFSVPGVETVMASTMAVNTGSQRVMEKLGMQQVHSYVGEWDDPIPGWEQGEVVYELTRPVSVTSSPRGPWPPSG